MMIMNMNNDDDDDDDDHDDHDDHDHDDHDHDCDGDENNNDDNNNNNDNGYENNNRFKKICRNYQYDSRGHRIIGMILMALSSLCYTSSLCYLIFTWTKWPPFPRRYFQMHFREWKVFISWLKFHWSLFLRGQLTITQQWFR